MSMFFWIMAIVMIVQGNIALGCCFLLYAMLFK